MLLEGKAAVVLATLLGAGVIAAFDALPSATQDVILAGAAITALKIVWSSTIKPVMRVGREVHTAVTSDLPERMRGVEDAQQAMDERLQRGDARFAAIEAKLDTWAVAERAAIDGALEATRRPRAARASDPGERTGWRE